MNTQTINNQIYKQILRDLVEIPDEHLKDVWRMIHEYRLNLSKQKSEAAIEKDIRLLDKLGGCLGEESVSEYDFDLQIGGYHE